MKTAAKHTEVSVSSNAPATVVGIDPAPENVSAAPAGWIAPKGVQKKGRRRAKASQVEVANDASKELRSKGAALAQELGPKVPDPAMVADALDRARAWKGVVVTATLFLKYARVQNAAAWNDALGHLEVLAPAVHFAVARDATFGERFPVTMKVTAKAPGGRKPRKPKAAAVATAEAPAVAEATPVATTTTKG